MDRRIDLPDRFQHSGHPEAGELAGQYGLIPGRWDETHGRQVVDLAGRGRLDGRHERGLVEEIPLHEFDAVEEVLDPVHRVGAGPARHADDSISLLEQELS